MNNVASPLIEVGYDLLEITNHDSIDTSYLENGQKSRIYNTLTGIDKIYKTEFGRLFLDNNRLVVNTNPDNSFCTIYLNNNVLLNGFYYQIFYMYSNVNLQNANKSLWNTKLKFDLTQFKYVTKNNLVNPWDLTQTQELDLELEYDVNQHISTLLDKINSYNIDTILISGDKIENGDVIFILKSKPHYYNSANSLVVNRVRYDISDGDNIGITGASIDTPQDILVNNQYETFTRSTNWISDDESSPNCRLDTELLDAGSERIIEEFNTSDFSVVGWNNILQFYRDYLPPVGNDQALWSKLYIHFGLCGDNIYYGESNADNSYNFFNWYYLPPGYWDSIKDSITLELKVFKNPRAFRCVSSQGNVFRVREFINYAEKQYLDLYANCNYGQGVVNPVQHTGLLKYPDLLSSTQTVDTFTFAFFFKVPDVVFEVFKTAYPLEVAEPFTGSNIVQYVLDNHTPGYIGKIGNFTPTNIVWGGHKLVFDSVRGKFYKVYKHIIESVTENQDVYTNLPKSIGAISSYRNLPEYGGITFPSLPNYSIFPKLLTQGQESADDFSYVDINGDFHSKRYIYKKNGILGTTGYGVQYNMLLSKDKASNAELEEQTIREYVTTELDLSATSAGSLNIIEDSLSRENIWSFNPDFKTKTSTLNKWIDTNNDNVIEYEPFDDTLPMSDMQLVDKIYCTGPKIRRGLRKLTKEQNHYEDENNFYCEEKNHQVNIVRK